MQEMIDCREQEELGKGEHTVFKKERIVQSTLF